MWDRGADRMVLTGRYRQGYDARRPVSRVLSPPRRMTAIHLGRLSPGASRGLPGRRSGNGFECRPYLALLPVGFTVPPTVAGGAVRSYRTLSPFPPRTAVVCFLWHFPWGRPRRALPGTVFPWSPDFPPTGSRRPAAVRPSGSIDVAIERPVFKAPFCLRRSVRGEPRCAPWFRHPPRRRRDAGGNGAGTPS